MNGVGEVVCERQRVKVYGIGCRVRGLGWEGVVVVVWRMICIVNECRVLG